MNQYLDTMINAFEIYKPQVMHNISNALYQVRYSPTLEYFHAHISDEKIGEYIVTGLIILAGISLLGSLGRSGTTSLTGDPTTLAPDPEPRKKE